MPLDTSRYSLEELLSARAAVDAERYPENAAALDAAIAERRNGGAPAEDAPAGPPRYASGWRRLGALLIDGFLIFLVLLVVIGLASLTPLTAILFLIFAAFLTPAYQVYFHARSGATPGKKALRIRVLRDDFSKIGPREALKRSSVDIALNGTQAAAGIGAIAISGHLFPLEGFLALNALLEQNLVYALSGSLIGLWGFSEIVTCLLNKRRKALHDFIAGTVVVVDPR